MLTIDYQNLIVESTSSIVDIVAFHDELRDYEESELGILYPVTHLWKVVPLGGGAFFYSVQFVNGWRLKFPNAGSYQIIGNITAEIVQVPGVFIEKITSAAFSTTTVGSTGFTLEEIAQEVWKKTLTGNQVPGSGASMLQDISARIASATN